MSSGTKDSNIDRFLGNHGTHSNGATVIVNTLPGRSRDRLRPLGFLRPGSPLTLYNLQFNKIPFLFKKLVQF